MATMARLLRSHPEGFTPSELALHVGCNRVTAHRYLDEWEPQAELVNDGTGRYRIDPTQYLENLKLTYAEALTIYLALRRFVRQTSKAPAFFVTAIHKIATALRHKHLTAQLAQSSLFLEAERNAAKEHADVWNTLIRGWQEHIVVRLKYQKNRSDDLSELDFEPYLFEPAVLSHGVYVIGWSRTRQAIRTLKLDRIVRASLTVATFQPREALQADEFLRHAWGVWYGDDLTRVELRFAPAVAILVQETIWHPSQQLQMEPDGCLLWSVEIAGLLELIPWIRGWGHEVEVIAPESLRREIADSMRQAAALYGEE
jgi:predicted DNA-binding transcriptional regulator YafY